jgi:hypothetical protein
MDVGLHVLAPEQVSSLLYGCPSVDTAGWGHPFRLSTCLVVSGRCTLGSIAHFPSADGLCQANRKSRGISGSSNR